MDSVKRLNVWLAVAAVVIAGLAAVGCGDGGKETAQTSALDEGGGRKADTGVSTGVYVGQPVSEFTSIFERKYKVEKGTIFLEGEDYDGYRVFENDEELFFAFTRYDNPDIVSRIWIFSPQFKTEKGIGVGATVADVKSEYKISDVMGVAQYLAVEGFSATFGLHGQFPEGYWEEENPTLPESHTVRTVIVDETDVMVTLDKQIIARKAEEAKTASDVKTVENPGVAESAAREEIDAGDLDTAISRVYRDSSAETWQEAYTGILRAYYALTSENDRLSFFLHDFDMNGTPELLVVGEYNDKIVDAVYTFRGGKTLSLDYGEGVSIAEYALSARTGVTPTPDNVPGLITYAIGASAGAFGSSAWYNRIAIDGNRLVVDVHGRRYVDLDALHELFDDFGRGSDIDDVALDTAIEAHTHYYINDSAVSAEELRRMFGEEEGLSPVRITEDNIRNNVVFRTN